MEKKLLFLFTELQPFRLSHFRQLLHDGYGVCVISFSHNFLSIIFKSCIHLVNILKMSMLSFDEDEINFNGIILFLTWLF